MCVHVCVCISMPTNANMLRHSHDMCVCLRVCILVGVCLLHVRTNNDSVTLLSYSVVFLTQTQVMTPARCSCRTLSRTRWSRQLFEIRASLVMSKYMSDSRLAFESRVTGACLESRVTGACLESRVTGACLESRVTGACLEFGRRTATPRE
jgi:hypothetical protein